MGKRNRGERGRESKKKGRSSSSGQPVESCSSDEGLGREDESKVRRTAATKPGAPLHSGLVMMQRHLGRQVEDCEAVDAVQAKCLEEGGWSVARHLEVLPEAAVSTMSSGLRGVVVKAERARLRLRQGKRERRKSGPSPATIVGGARSKKKNPPSRSAKRPGGRKMGDERPPEGSAVEQPVPRRSERPEQGKAKQAAVAGEVAPLVVCVPHWQRGTWARNCRPTASTCGGPGAPMVIRAAGETRLKLKLGPSRAAQLWY